MPLQATSGAASYDAFGGGVPSEPNYIESVFSCFLYTGNDTTQTITNGIDLSTKGGMVWIKPRNQAQNHVIFDTVGGITKSLATNNTNAQYTATGGNEGLASFNTTGFTAKLYQDSTGINNSACNLVSWTFRKQPKFFDVVTYNSGPSGTTGFSHNLGSVPATIFIKRTSSNSDWFVYHRSLGDTKWVKLNTTDAETNFGSSWITVTSTTVSTENLFGANSNIVAYLFAHDAGGFGLTGTDNVISCGSYTGNGSTTGPVVTLGYEPQWLMIKNASAATDWVILDTMRGLVVGGTDRELNPNQSGAESGAVYITPTATGFELNTTNGAYNASGNTFIYIAIRRGPMKVPTSGTSVYNAIARNGTGALVNVTGVGFAPDLVTVKNRNAGYDPVWVDKLRGNLPILASSSTAAEVTDNTDSVKSFNMDGITLGGDNPGTYGGAFNFSTSNSYINWFFKRAPSFFDEVCYTGTGSARTVTHNLAAVPELMIVKKRNAAASWTVYSKSIPITHNLILNNGTASAASAVWNSTAPTSSVFSVSTLGAVNANLDTYVAYLFATCPNVSKVGSYTGNGTTQTINCGFTGGARFVLIKRTDDVGDWYVYDTARGMTVLTDPYLWLNSTAAQVATLGSVTTVSTGFALDSAILADINVSGGTFIFFAVA